MEELSLHILDIAMNSIRAGATKVTVEVVENARENAFLFVVRDNGSGMTEDQLSRVHDPFYTTRDTRRVGLGIPLLKQTAEQAGGSLVVTSSPGKGTTVEARFELDHVDRPPLGDVAATIWTLVVTNAGVEFDYRHAIDGACFEVNTAELKEKLAVKSLGKPSIAGALLKYLRERERGLAESPALRDGVREGKAAR